MIGTWTPRLTHIRNLDNLPEPLTPSKRKRALNKNRQNSHTPGTSPEPVLAEPGVEQIAPSPLTPSPSHPPSFRAPRALVRRRYGAFHPGAWWRTPNVGDTVKGPGDKPNGP